MVTSLIEHKYQIKILQINLLQKTTPKRWFFISNYYKL
jgi:hypothetical protein